MEKVITDNKMLIEVDLRLLFEGNGVSHSPAYFLGMAQEPQPAPQRRKRGVHLYLRDDVLKTIERVAAGSELSVSRVVDILLTYYWEFNDIAEKGRFLSEVYRRFRRSS